MFNKILIANRGEIAVRIIRACREMGIRTVAVYSEADRDALHTQLADEAVCIGKAQSSDSYLNMERILSATIATKAEAIHPGFGFLSENSRFVEMCEKCNVAFIGPSAEVISRMGNKSEAKNTMRKAKVPVVPGTKEPVYTVEQALEAVKEIGFPVMIKASAGGGGKGMRVAGNEQEFAKLFETAQQCNFGIGLCDIDRILKPFFIIPHKLSARSFLFPWEWLFHPFPDGFSGLICNVNNQGTICFGVFF